MKKMTFTAVKSKCGKMAVSTIELVNHLTFYVKEITITLNESELLHPKKKKKKDLIDIDR